MARLGRCKWTGISGKRHRYAIYQLPCRFRPGQQGNYIFARYSHEKLWVPVYIGQGDLGACSGPDHPLWQKLIERGATHFHCHLAPVAHQRMDERVDLMARYLNTYEPFGCNTLHDLVPGDSPLPPAPAPAPAQPAHRDSPRRLQRIRTAAH